MSKKKTQVPTFEEALAELEQIVKKLESNTLPLDDALQLFEEGVRLSRHCRQYLETAQQRVEQVIANHQGDLTVKPFIVTEEVI